MDATKVITGYAMYAQQVGAEVLGALAGKWRIGRIIQTALNDAALAPDRSKLFAEVETLCGSQYKEGVLQQCRVVYEAFPSSIPVEGIDCPSWAQPGQIEYSQDWGIYPVLARSTALKTEFHRLLWARYTRCMGLKEAKAVLKYAIDKGLTGTPETAFDGYTTHEKTEQAARLKAAQETEEKERAIAEANRLLRLAQQEKANRAHNDKVAGYTPEEMASFPASEVDAAQCPEAMAEAAWDEYNSIVKVEPLDALLSVLRVLQAPPEAFEGVQQGNPASAINHAVSVMSKVDLLKISETTLTEKVSELQTMNQQGATMLSRWEAMALAMMHSQNVDATGWEIDAYEKLAFSQIPTPGAQTGKAFKRIKASGNGVMVEV